MTTDIEQELRELFREKAGEAPLATPRAPATAPPQVLRRGRRRQVGTVLGSLAIVVVLVAGSVAGLQRLLADREPLPTANYDVFERTATVEAFTVTGPSDWYLVNQWPQSMMIAVQGTAGSSSFECQGVPVGSGEVPECIDTVGEETSTPLPVPHGLPMLQLSNVDLGLDASACREGIPNSGAALYVAYDIERAISGVADPTVPAFPPDPGLPSEGDGPCGPGRYTHFTVNGEPFFAWIGLGSAVTDQHRETVETAYERMSAIPDWTPEPPDHLTPGYVIIGGPGWRLELRSVDGSLELSLIDGLATLLADGSAAPLAWTGTDPIIGVVTKAASDVEFRPTGDEAPVPGTVVPVPPTIDAFGLDAFFIDPPTGVGDAGGTVVALGLEDDVSAMAIPAPSPSPVADVASLSGGNDQHTWIVRFTGAFVDDSACIRVRVDSNPLDPACPTLPEGAQAGDLPSLHGWLTDTMYLLAGAVPSDVADIRFVSNEGGSGITELQCTTGPVGWTDTNVCVLTLPPAGSGTLRYLDAEGNVLFEEGFAWGAAEAALPPGVVDPVHGGTYWAVYPWFGSPGDPEAEDVSARLLESFGVEAFPGDFACDQGAAEALGTDAEQRIGVYFETEEDANAFAQEVGALDASGDPVVAQVTTYCLD